VTAWRTPFHRRSAGRTRIAAPGNRTVVRVDDDTGEQMTAVDAHVERRLLAWIDTADAHGVLALDDDRELCTRRRTVEGERPVDRGFRHVVRRARPSVGPLPEHLILDRLELHLDAGASDRGTVLVDQTPDDPEAATRQPQLDGRTPGTAAEGHAVGHASPGHHRMNLIGHEEAREPNRAVLPCRSNGQDHSGTVNHRARDRAPELVEDAKVDRCERIDHQCAGLDDLGRSPVIVDPNPA
jgi:hypothetical protein